MFSEDALFCPSFSLQQVLFLRQPQIPQILRREGVSSVSLHGIRHQLSQL